jgi:hypothetical protein
MSLQQEAPAQHHMVVSTTTVCRRAWRFDCNPSSTHEFWCFQISEATRMIREFSPFRVSFGTPLITLHQLEKLVPNTGATTARFSHCKQKNQTCREKTHESSKCWIVSSAWSQNGQAVGWGNPRLASQSAVQHLLLKANHKKNLQCKGAQHFQILLQGVNLMVPTKNAA